MTKRMVVALPLAVLLLLPRFVQAQTSGSAQAPASRVVRTPRAQMPPTPIEPITFEAAIQRALANNPNVAIAENAIRRAEALLQQARTVTRPTVTGGVTTTILDSERAFGGQVSQPQTQSVFAGNVSYPILAPSRWA